MNPLLECLLYFSAFIIGGILCAGYTVISTAILNAIWKGEIHEKS
jgi:hypothetical protein